MKIIHVDMDAFFASVEQADDPALRGRPVVVGGDPEGRGVVAAASYEARVFGVHSAMPCARAARLCPDAVFVRPRLPRYRAVSKRIMDILRSATSLVEPLSLDEAYLDVTENHLGEPLAREIAAHLKRRIVDETGLTASAGVGPNKFVAKLASDMRKPDGLVVIPPDRVLEMLDSLPVERLWGVGPATTRRLHAMGIRTAGQLRDVPAGLLRHAFGKQGDMMHALAHGRDDRPVVPARRAKSRGAETTFSADLQDVEALEAVLRRQAESVAESLGRMARPGRTITLKVRHADFHTLTRSHTLAVPTDDPAVITDTAAALLRRVAAADPRPIRLVGVSVSGLVDPGGPTQLALPGEEAPAPAGPVGGAGTKRKGRDARGKRATSGHGARTRRRGTRPAEPGSGPEQLALAL